MNGASALPSVNTMSRPKRTSIITIGNNHHFLRVFKNPQNSLRMLIFILLILLSASPFTS